MDREFWMAIRQVIINALDAVEIGINKHWPGSFKVRNAELRQAYKDGKLLV